MGALVKASSDSIRNVRRTETARKEAEFQKAIADGMSYAAQIDYRQKQLDDEQKSSFSDPDFVSTLTSSLTNLKKLNRFSVYRTKYAATLAELNAGKVNEETFVSSLRGMLDGVTDADLRLEIQQDIADGETKAKNYKDTILSNDVKKAQYDGTVPILTSTIQEVKDARNAAAISGNRDEVSAYDATLAALGSQLGTAQIEDDLSKFQVDSAIKGGSPNEKLNALNAKAQSADATAPVTINGQRYSSAQAYWTSTRDGYLSGDGTGMFADFFRELENKYTNTINGTTAKFGFMPDANISSIKLELDTVRSRPEMQPYLAQLDNLQNLAIAAAVKTQADVINSRATYTGNFVGADAALQALGTKYGTDVSAYRLDLGNKLVQYTKETAAATGQDVTPPDSLLPAADFPNPGETPPPTTPPATPGSTPAVPPTQTPATGGYTVKSGDNLGKIASQNGMSVSQLLDLNPQYKTNPNLIKPGETIKLSAPKVEETPPVATTPPPAVPPVTPPATPPVTPGGTPPSPTPTPAEKPVTPAYTFKPSGSNVEVYDASGQRVSTTTKDNAKVNYGYTGV